MQNDPHPDSHELDGWPIYGPKDPQISTLVAHLAVRHRMRVKDIEALIVATLQERLAQEEEKKAWGEAWREGRIAVGRSPACKSRRNVKPVVRQPSRWPRSLRGRMIIPSP